MQGRFSQAPRSRGGDAAPRIGAPARREAPLASTASCVRPASREFVSSAYFLRFRFEEGKCALVGREKLDVPTAGRENPSAPAASDDAEKIEATRPISFRGTDRRRNDRPTSDDDKAYDAEFRRLMNKTALIALGRAGRAPDRQIPSTTSPSISCRRSGWCTWTTPRLDDDGATVRGRVAAQTRWIFRPP